MKRWAQGGFTIFEVIIVIAVSSILFITASSLLAGKQGQSELNQSIRSVESQLQTVASDVANGYYPGGYKCTVTASGPSIQSTTTTSGTSLGCILIGKIINLHETKADIITVLGKQYSSGVVDVNNLSEAMPKVAATDTVDLTSYYDYLYGLKITKAVSVADSVTTYKALGFITELAGTTGAGSRTASSRSTLLYGLIGNAASNVTAPKDIDASALVAVPGGIRLCFAGGNGKKAEIIVGGSGDQTNLELLIDNGVGNDC